ncbi:MAG: hypothetical protein P4L49_00825 [Desulfosporosinus sp.]|nr:hypothetical protein [Desulfosporosinus sp.]
MSITKNVKQNWLDGIILSLFSLWMIVLLFRHEPWVDETQTFLLVRDLSFGDLFRQLKFEGHPLAWYLLIFPFIKLGFPIFIQNVLSTLLGIGSAYIILYKSPFERFIRIIFLVSSPVMFQFTVVARSYSILTFVLLCILVIHPKRYEKRWVILYALGLFILINTHLYAALIAGAFFSADLIEFIVYQKIDPFKNKRIIFVGISFLLATVLLFITNYPGQYYHVYQKNYLDISNTRLSIQVLWKLLYTIFSNSIPFSSAIFNRLPSIAYYIIPSGFFMGVLLLLIFHKNSKNAVSFYVTNIILITVLSRMIYYNQHMGGILVLVLWATVWLARPIVATKLTLVLFSLVLVLLSNNYVLAIYSLNHPFSGAKAAANFLIENHFDEQNILIVTPNEEVSAILPFMHNIKQIKAPEGLISYIDWRYLKNETQTDTSKIKSIIGNDTTHYKHILILIEDGTEITGNFPYPEIYPPHSGQEKAICENFIIYKLK